MRTAVSPVFAFALSGVLFAQEPLIRVDVNLVRVIATVKNPAGELVGSLTADDFEIQDNGIPQKVAVFERQTQQPLNVALLMDTSGSTAKDLKLEVQAIERFLRAFFAEGNPEDRIAIFTFNYEVKARSTFTRNRRGLERALRGLKGEAGTAVYDAIFLASEALEDRDGRKVMVVVTDGSDTASRTDFHRALKAAHLADAVIYPIVVVPITNDAGRSTGGENALTTMAERTGGRPFFPDVPSLDTAFVEILRDLRTQYFLGFYPKDVPPSDNPFHRLDVRVRRPGLQVLARNGYYGDSGDAAGVSSGRISIAPQRVRQTQPAKRSRQEKD
jgi:Ca-activated chloride channel family protein